MNLQTVSNITIRYSVVGNIGERVAGAALDTLGSVSFADKRAGISVCGYAWPKDKCKDIFINNNIVGGVPYAGFVTMA